MVAKYYMLHYVSEIALDWDGSNSASFLRNNVKKYTNIKLKSKLSTETPRKKSIIKLEQSFMNLQNS